MKIKIPAVQTHTPSTDTSFPSSSPVSSAPISRRGFSLIECISALMILAILLAIGVPQMQGLVRDTQVSTGINQFVGAQALARAEAVRRGRLVTICRSVRADLGSDACDDSATPNHGATDWGTGWLIFVENDSQSGGIGRVDENDEILARQGELSDWLQGSSSVKRITYNATGVPIGMAGANWKFHFNGKYQRVLCMARSGRLRVAQGVQTCEQT